jgi:hypothetical protein
MMKRAMAGLIAVMFLAGLSFAAEQKAEGTLLKLKSGTCTFKILASDGVKPLADAQLALAGTADGKEIATAKSDVNGKCTLDIKDGRYILKVNTANLAILDASSNNEISDCRIVVPAQNLQVGGQGTPPGGTPPAGNPPPRAAGPLPGGPGGGTGGKIFGMSTTTLLIIGGTAVLVPVLVNNLDDDDDDNGGNPPPNPQPNPPKPQPSNGGGNNDDDDGGRPFPVSR